MRFSQSSAVLWFCNFYDFDQHKRLPWTRNLCRFFGDSLDAMAILIYFLAIFYHFFGFCDVQHKGSLRTNYRLAIFCRFFGFCDVNCRSTSLSKNILAIFCRFFGFCDALFAKSSQSFAVSLVFATTPHDPNCFSPHNLLPFLWFLRQYHYGQGHR